MDVTLIKTWFAPSERVQLDRLRSSSGFRLKKGRHRNLPEYLRDPLPKDAVQHDRKPDGSVENDPYEEHEPEPEEQNLSDFDTERAGQDAVAAIIERDENPAEEFQRQLDEEAAEEEASEEEAAEKPAAKKSGKKGDK